MPEACWCQVQGSELHQGDFLPEIHVPLFRSPFVDGEVGDEVEASTEVQSKDVIIVTQTCDLVNEKIRFVALCPVETVQAMETQQPKFAKRWNEVRIGRHEGLHMLGPLSPDENHKNGLIVDFREIISLPTGYVQKHAIACGERFRLLSPFLEHFSQAFGKFYMRVALPDFIAIP